MKKLTIEEALKALKNGEKITSSYLEKSLVKFVYQIESGVREDITHNIISAKSLVSILAADNLRIYKEFVYPMWFKDLANNNIVKFDGFKSGVVVLWGGTSDFQKGYYTDKWKPHTNKETWEQVEEPKKMIKIAKYAFLGEDEIGYKETPLFYKCEDDFLQIYKPHKLIDYKRLDCTEIEVEDY